MKEVKLDLKNPKKKKKTLPVTNKNQNHEKVLTRKTTNPTRLEVCRSHLIFTNLKKNIKCLHNESIIKSDVILNFDEDTLKM